MVSETSLIFVPSGRFHLKSMDFKDWFMEFAIDALTATVVNLIQKGYIQIDEEVKTYGILNISVWKTLDYKVRLLKKPSDKFVIGWVEEVIFENLDFAKRHSFAEVMYNVLNYIFEGTTGYSNGRRFTLELLKHQRLHRYGFDHKKRWFVNTVNIWKDTTKVQKNESKPVNLENLHSEKVDVIKVRKIIGLQFYKFQVVD